MKRLAQTIKGLWSLLVGLKITGAEFCKPWLTVHYPRQEVDNLASFRGHIELVPTAENPLPPRCLICWTCVGHLPVALHHHPRACRGRGGRSGRRGRRAFSGAGSAGAVFDDTWRRRPKRSNASWTSSRLNYSLCSLCGLCVQSCPAEAIRFSRNSYLAGHVAPGLRIRPAVADEIAGRRHPGAAFRYLRAGEYGHSGIRRIRVLPGAHHRRRAWPPWPAATSCGPCSA